MSLPTKFSDITIDMVKAYFGETDNSKDARLTVLLPIVKDRIISYCNNPFEILDIPAEKILIENCKNIFFSKERPIIQINSLTINDVVQVENVDYIVEKSTGKFKFLGHLGNYFLNNLWGNFNENIVLNYRAGEELTMDVVQVFYEYVGIFTGLRTRSYITNTGIEAVVSLNDVPAEFKAVLDLHTRMRDYL